jgi:hypothetical protein
MWRHDSMGDAIRAGHTGQQQSLIQRLGTVIDPWEKMAMEIDHESLSRNNSIRVDAETSNTL